MTSFETLLSHLPDRAAALNYTKSLPINEIETILSECIRNTSINDPRFIYIWQICQITLNKPAISPDGTIKSLLPLAKWHLSYLLGAGGVPAMKHRLQQMFGKMSGSSDDIQAINNEYSCSKKERIQSEIASTNNDFNHD